MTNRCTPIAVLQANKHRPTDLIYELLHVHLTAVSARNAMNGEGRHALNMLAVRCILMTKQDQPWRHAHSSWLQHSAGQSVEPSTIGGKMEPFPTGARLANRRMTRTPAPNFGTTSVVCRMQALLWSHEPCQHADECTAAWLDVTWGGQETDHQQQPSQMRPMHSEPKSH